MKDAIINLVWVWAQASDSSVSKESVYNASCGPITCIQTLPNGQTLCDISFWFVNKHNLITLLALAAEADLHIDSCIVVAGFRVIRLYFQPSITSDNGTN